MKKPIPHLREQDETIIRMYLRHAMPFFLEGGPGIGKSLAAHYLGRVVYHSQHCRGRDRHEADDRNALCQPIKIDITEDTEVRHLLGEVNVVRYFLDARQGSQPRDMADYFVDGPLVKAMKSGQLLIIEELDRAGRETLFPVLFDAIERKTVYIPDLGQQIEALDTFNIVITVNRFTDVGTVRLPEALLRRLRRVSLYDPGLDGYDQPAGAADAAEEHAARRQFAYDFERILVFNNLAAETGAESRSSVPIDETITQHLGQALVKRAEHLLDLVYQLRGELRAAQSMLAGERITPAEASRFVCDVILCEQKALLASDQDALRVALQRHVGALAKNEEHAQAIANSIDRGFVEGRPPFKDGGTASH